MVAQRATSDDVPSSLKPGLSTTMAFKLNNPGDASAINLPLAATIKIDERGKCASEEGLNQYPYMNMDEWNPYLNSLNPEAYPKNLILDLSLIKKIKQNKIEYILPERTIKELVQDISSVGALPSLQAIFKKQGYEVQDFDGKYDIKLSLTKDGEKTLVMIKSKANLYVAKHIPILKQMMLDNQYTKGLVIVYDGMLSPLDSATKSENIVFVDKEDLENL